MPASNRKSAVADLRISGEPSTHSMLPVNARSPARSRRAILYSPPAILAGYDTAPFGVLLVSSFTAAMHRKKAMSEHVLPAIFSWRLGIALNEFVGAAKGTLIRGNSTVGLFGPKWDSPRNRFVLMRARIAVRSSRFEMHRGLNFGGGACRHGNIALDHEQVSIFHAVADTVMRQSVAIPHHRALTLTDR